jgi:hypothetical protein
MSVDWFFTTQGRITRIVVGSLLIIIGLGIIGGIFGVILLLIGAVPIASAAYGTFLLAPFFGRDIRGNKEGGAPIDPDAEDDEQSDDAPSEDSGGDDSPRDESRSDDPPRDDSAADDSSRDDDDAPSRDDKPTGARPVRAERPPGQGPRTKDLRAEGSGSSGSDES